MVRIITKTGIYGKLVLSPIFFRRNVTVVLVPNVRATKVILPSFGISTIIIVMAGGGVDKGLSNRTHFHVLDPMLSIPLFLFSVYL